MLNKQPPSHRHFAAACDAFKGAHNISELEREFGLPKGTLHNKFNPASEKHKLSALDLIALYHATGDDLLFDGLLLDCGLTAVRLPESGAAIRPEARAQQALNVSAQIMGVTAQATQVLSGGRVTKLHRNALMGGLLAGIEQMVLLATEVEEKYHTVPGATIAADIFRAGFGA